MALFPSEIMEIILQNLVDFRDSDNASKVCRLWGDVLHPLKSSWLFGQAFPLIFEYLTTREILQCRLVCKQWCFGVDYFLENNAYHRPVTGKLSNSELLKTDLPVNSLEKLFTEKKLVYNYNFSNYGKQINLMMEARSHSRCPIVGRSLYISGYTDHTHQTFLQIFGRHISYLRVHISTGSVKSLETILKLLSFAPNLKTLRIEGQFWENCDYNNTQQLSEFVLKFCCPSGYEKRSRLPKLEALQISMMKEQEICKYWNYCLIRCLSTEKLESFHLSRMNNLEELKLKNVVDLSINVNSVEDLENISLLNSLHLRRLSIELRGTVSSRNLLETIKLFGKTLRNLELNFSTTYKFFAVTNPHFLKGFADRQVFNGGMMNLKRVTLHEFLPPSLNFLLGLSNSLEYLSVRMEPELPSGQQRYLALKCKEKIDLLKRLHGVPHNKTPEIYESNVWKKFPKLKLLTVNRQRQKIQYRTDYYNKYMDKQLLVSQRKRNNGLNFLHKTFSNLKLSK